MVGSYQEVEGVSIHYHRVGVGPQVLLLIPGSIGCGESDFYRQLDGGLDHGLFTMIAIDLPGWGRSRPPARDNSSKQHLDDVRKAAGLMEKLGFRRYSVLGWCFGAKIAQMLAIKFQARVDKLVYWGAGSFLSAQDMRALLLIRDVDHWDRRVSQPYLIVYGRSVFQQIWSDFVDNLQLYESEPEKYWDARKELRNIRCPVLILHGDRDPLCSVSHPSVSERELADSRVFRFPEGAHDIHQIYPNKFNAIVTDFLLE